MKYSKEFKALIDSTHENYIGHGNPNTKILFMGQEPAIDCQDNAEQYKLEIADNAEQWRHITNNGIGYESVDSSKIEFGLPLHPWANQKFQVRTGSEKDENLKGEKGTARTWYNYQKLINKIFELWSEDRKAMTKDNHLDFHCYSFHADMSAVASKKHDKDNKEEKEKGRKSVKAREALFSSDFFRKFPVVIAAVGHFPRETYGRKDGERYFMNLFNVYLANTISVGKLWININKSDNKLLIHCPQFSANISNNFISRTAQIVIDFAKEHNIDLMPEE